MAVYAIGDVQGCLSALQRLLEKIKFDPTCDNLWLTGDLINRGPDSLQTLRLIRSLGKATTVVLGNHDLHFLAVYSGKKPSQKDTFDDLLAADDIDELALWLRHQPLAHCDPQLKIIMTHAGVYPSWTKAQLCEHASIVEAQLKSNDYGSFINAIYGASHGNYAAQSSQNERERFIINALTRMRFCHLSGALDFTMKGAPSNQLDEQWLPWYQHPELNCEQWRIVFGHWSALGYQQVGNIISLDSGCVWGGKLTAVQLDADYQAPYWQVECPAC